MSDWQPGDLALCVNDRPMEVACGCALPHIGSPAIVAGRVYEVRALCAGDAVAPGWGCTCTALLFENAAGIVQRFRKLQPLTTIERKAAEEDLRVLRPAKVPA